MTDVVERTATAKKGQDPLAHSLGTAFALTPRRLELLTAAVRGHRVNIPPSPLQLPLGVSQSRIDAFRRDIVDYSPEGVSRLQARLARAEEQHNDKAAATLRSKIAKAPSKFETAQIDLTAALELRSRREQALLRWLNGCGLRGDALTTLVRSLRHNVTYMYYMNERVLYVETD